MVGLSLLIRYLTEKARRCHGEPISLTVIGVPACPVDDL